MKIHPEVRFSEAERAALAEAARHLTLIRPSQTEAQIAAMPREDRERWERPSKTLNSLAEGGDAKRIAAGVAIFLELRDVAVGESDPACWEVRAEGDADRRLIPVLVEARRSMVPVIEAALRILNTAAIRLDDVATFVLAANLDDPEDDDADGE